MLLAGGILLKGLPTLSGLDDELIMNEKDVDRVLRECDKASCSQPAVLEEIRAQVHSHVWVRSVQSQNARFRLHRLSTASLLCQTFALASSIALHGPAAILQTLEYLQHLGVFKQYHGDSSDQHASIGSSIAGGEHSQPTNSVQHAWR